ncbi:MAG: hypothetical protein ABEH35_01430 [Haloarculaceae archaeon]
MSTGPGTRLGAEPRRSRSPAVDRPRDRSSFGIAALVVFVGLLVIVVGLFCFLLAVYVLGALSSMDGFVAGPVGSLLVAPLYELHSGGLFMVLAGWVCVMTGGIGLLR